MLMLRLLYTHRRQHDRNCVMLRSHYTAGELAVPAQLVRLSSHYTELYRDSVFVGVLTVLRCAGISSV